jgi:hypothetical protein
MLYLQADQPGVDTACCFSVVIGAFIFLPGFLEIPFSDDFISL